VQGDHNIGWAITQRNLGLALKTLGVMSGDIERIREGADAYRSALTIFTREQAPQDYAQTNAILGFALMEIAKSKPTPELLEEARDAFSAARDVFGPLSSDDDAYFAGRIDEIDGMLG
jgi:hypothetical protein